MVQETDCKKIKKTIGIQTLAIIPCYNEETTIGSIILKTKRYVDKVLVIDDGSIDETAKIAKDAGATVISHKINRGKGDAILTGFRYALDHDFDYVVTIDGDGQHNPVEIPLLIGNIMNNGHDISLGFRVGHDTEMPKWRKVGKRVLDYATSFGSGGFVTDSQCGFRAFSRKAVNELTPTLKSNSFSVESEQLIRAHKLGLGLVNTNVTCKYNNLENTSTKNPASHGFSVLRHIIILVAEKHPLLFIGVPGFVLVILGLFFGILTIQYYNQTQIFLVPYAIMISIFLIIGALAIFMGLMLTAIPHMIGQSRGKQE
ncbi:MAG: glycosyltransferase family 2 protein [Thermoplasmatales archaeon]|nr:glycosyltransferase family 2 protein [Thermoplasmatales archaeon]